MHSRTNRKLNIVRDFIQENYKDWEGKYSNMLGAYPGMKHRKNKPSGRYAIVFLVSEKGPDAGSLVPGYFNIDIPKSQALKIPTDVVVADRYNLWNVSLSGRIQRSASPEYGTIGLFLGKEGRKYACTNAHVLCLDKIEEGETYFYRPIEKQFQPDVDLYDKDGRIYKAYLQEAVFGGIDAAICRIEDEESINNSIPGFGVPTGIKTINYSDTGYNVKMVGLKTGFSEGAVERVGLTIPSPYSNIHFHDVIELSIKSQHGDSGSPVFNDALKIIGIIVGGTDRSAYVIPINQILDRFNCILLN